MLASVASKLLAGLLVSTIVGAIFTTVMGQTVLNSHYLEGRLTAIHGYSRLSTALSNEASRQNGSTVNPQIAAQLQTILTPAVIKQKLNGALDQLQTYYRGNGPVPTLNLSDLAAQARAAGLQLEQDNSLTQPLVLGGVKDTQAQHVTKTFDHVRLGTILSSTLLTVMLLAISWKRRRYQALPNVLISVGVFTALLATACYLSSSVVGHLADIGGVSNAFTSLGRDLAESIAKDLSWRFGVIAATCLAVGVTGRILIGRLQAHAVIKRLVARQNPITFVK